MYCVYYSFAPTCFSVIAIFRELTPIMLKHTRREIQQSYSNDTHQICNFYLKYSYNPLKCYYNMIVWCVMLRGVCLECARGLHVHVETHSLRIRKRQMFDPYYAISSSLMYIPLSQLQISFVLKITVCNHSERFEEVPLEVT